jgi:hypothetical protein
VNSPVGNRTYAPPYLLLAVRLLAALVVVAADKPAPQSPAAAERAANVQVIACYFHGTIRCEMCQKIERQARGHLPALR